MKAGILTFWFADNYGAVLQGLALLEACKKYVEDVRIIDYIPTEMVSLKFRLKKKLLPKKFEIKFEQFRKKHFPMLSVKEECDVLLVGSDQVWNFNINGYDRFWISPKMNYKKLCSYAASFGKNNFTEKDEQYLLEQKSEFEKYSFVTVREKAGQEILEKINVKSETVCDPTFLFYENPEFYEQLAQNSEYWKASGYLLVYSLETSAALDEKIRQMKEETGRKVIAIHPMNARLQECDEFINDASVYDFLALIKNAEYILTNSFHGLAFSYIFRKKVYCVHHSALSSRQSELINASGFVYEKQSENVYFVDTDQTSDVMSQFVETSEEKLKTMLMI